METWIRHQRIWRLIQKPAGLWMKRRFNTNLEPIVADGNFLLVCNHVSAWDPILTGLALGKAHHAYYVATEHLLRGRIKGPLLDWAFGPIPRRKGTNDFETVRKILKALRAGRSVVLFAEGEQSWDGRSIPIVPSTGSLVKSAGVPLVTYRLEGAYLSAPRWGKGTRKGKINGRCTGVYSADALQEKSAAEINALIERDIRENAWQRQLQQSQTYQSKSRAMYLERLLYLCPRCKAVGSLHSAKDALTCNCGFTVRMEPGGFFASGAPFRDAADWEDWQKQRLWCRDFCYDVQSGILFEDSELTLVRILPGHREERLGQGKLVLHEDRMECAGRSFTLNGISQMAMVRHNRLLFTWEDDYFEMRSRKKETNLRKYLEIWNQKHFAARESGK